MHIENSFFPKN